VLDDGDQLSLETSTLPAAVSRLEQMLEQQHALLRQLCPQHMLTPHLPRQQTWKY